MRSHTVTKSTPEWVLHEVSGGRQRKGWGKDEDGEALTPRCKTEEGTKKKKNQPVIKMNSILMQLILKSKLKLSPKIHEEQTFTILNKDRIKLWQV